MLRVHYPLSMVPTRLIATRLHAGLVPMVVVVVALLGAALISESESADFNPPAISMVIGLPTASSVSVQARPTVLRTPAPRAGKLRVREADRLGPARLYLPPPAV